MDFLEDALNHDRLGRVRILAFHLHSQTRIAPVTLRRERECRSAAAIARRIEVAYVLVVVAVNQYVTHRTSVTQVERGHAAAKRIVPAVVVAGAGVARANIHGSDER